MEAPEAPPRLRVSRTRRLRLSVRTTCLWLIRHGVLHEVVKRRLVDDLIRTVILDEQDYQEMFRERAAVRQQPDGPTGEEALQDPDDLRLLASQLCSRKNPIVPSSSSAKRSISASVVVRPRLARAVPERP
jgi:hypothetical protein